MTCLEGPHAAQVAWEGEGEGRAEGGDTNPQESIQAAQIVIQRWLVDAILFRKYWIRLGCMFRSAVDASNLAFEWVFQS